MSNEQRWQRLSELAAPDVVAALRSAYDYYDGRKLIEWVANLYDVEVGGFYYSNSGRNTEGYLPDIESTNQALSFLESSGMLSSLGGRYSANVPAWMKNEIVAFVKGLQDESGYFYHPQWSRELHHQNPERMGRDLSWATSMLVNFGAKPYYTTPGGKLQGEGKPSETNLTGKLRASKASAVSKIAATAGLNSHLATPETFKAYLASLNIRTQSYSAGSAVGAQTTTIKELDRKLAGITSDVGFDYRNNGVYSKILFDWLD